MDGIALFNFAVYTLVVVAIIFALYAIDMLCLFDCCIALRGDCTSIPKEAEERGGVESLEREADLYYKHMGAVIMFGAFVPLYNVALACGLLVQCIIDYRLKRACLKVSSDYKQAGRDLYLSELGKYGTSNRTYSYSYRSFR